MHQSVTNRHVTYIKKEANTSTKGLFIIGLILLCLMSMDFFSLFFYIVFALFCFILCCMFRGFEIPQITMPVAILSVSMCLFSPTTRGGGMAMIRPFAYPACIIIGYNLIRTESVEKAGKRVKWLIVALSTGAYCHYIFNMLYNWGKDLNRNTFDYWTKTILSATGQSTLACLMIGLSVCVIFTKSRLIYKVLSTGVIVSILYYNLVLGGRTIFILVIILFVLNIILEFGIRKTVSARIVLLFSVVFFAMIGLLFVRNNIFGVVDTFNKSNFYKRFYLGYGGLEITEDSRFNFKIMYLMNMFNYPFGGNELYRAVGNHYAHDLLLDTYSDSSIFAFSAILVLIICLFVSFRRIMRVRAIDVDTRRIIVCSLVTFFVIFTVEPILRGMPWLFASFCVLCGAIKKIEDYL